MRREPIIMTAMLGSSDQVWANALRRAHYPADRNVVDAHVTLFHHLPGPYEGELVVRTRALAREYAPPAAQLSDVMRMGNGVAYRIHSPGLLAIRAMMADGLHGLLTAQDQGVPRLHITVQNKVEAAAARTLHAELSAVFVPRPLVISGLALHRYLGGPWEPIGNWPFRGKAQVR
ncbi:2'-5' RNA ligase superfamily protein [Blastomonas natatoria]|uniref:2'-5' RNA ligase superfamily protein n=1 Tax=Blastomonas natatoria TaxID=34015 RepID=A0A2V3UTW0_9SPHN|nr:2'-5' RNA ligase family protein [Blastomonas natatoria]PXW71623.1 2'-5' RNA ligase superfamily protein [Blastomonas natatoria]